MSTLAEIEQDVLALYAVLEDDPDGDAIPNAIKELERMLAERGDKLDRIGSLLLRMQRDAEACRAEADSLMKRARAKENAADRVRGIVRHVMLASGERRMDGATVSFRLMEGREVARVQDARALPPELVTYPEPVPDKREILRLLKIGVEVPGATLERGEPSLVVRR
jgi:hypothetical protein